MRGYRNDPHRTNDVLDAEGWLATGDIVTQDDDGYVTIIDRKKELIINAAGKNMSPSNIENAITVACSIVGNVIAIGDNRPYNVALVVLDPDAAASIASNHDITDTSPASLAANSVLKSIVDNGIRAANERLSRVEQIKRFEILPEPWLPGGTFLTPTMKLKRRAVIEAYADVIDRLYEAPRVATTGDNHA